MTRRTLSCVATLAALVTSYAKASLPIFGGATYSVPTDTGFYNATISASPQSCITDKGFAIGEATFHSPTISDGGVRALNWTPSGSATLPTGPDPVSGVKNTHVGGVNNASTAVGDRDVFAANGSSLGVRALRWTNGGSAMQLNDLGLSQAGYGVVRALAVNANDVAVGASSKYVGAEYRGSRPVRWEAGSPSRTELGVLQPNSAGAVDGQAIDINDAGIVAGFSGLWSNNVYVGTRATRWDNAGVITALGTLGASADGSTIASAVGINNAGVIIGAVQKYNAAHTFIGNRAVRYLANGTTALELGTLGTAADGSTVSAARGISDTGMIVGSSNDYFGSVAIGSRAVYWAANSSLATELPNLGLDANAKTFARANSSNADGVIAGTSDKYSNGAFTGRVAVIWTTTGTDAVIDLNTLLPANSGWTLGEAVGISNTGFVSGTGYYTPNGANSYIRHFSMLVPQAGTYGRGDANLDESINFADLVILAQHYNQSNASKPLNVGDFNLDGATNFADLVALAQHYNTSVSSVIGLGDASFAADWALAQSFVPEPTALAGVVLPVFTRRRRRTQIMAGAIALVASPAMSHASLPLFAGPGGPAGPTGITNPSAGIGQGINNHGVALALASSVLNGNSTGTHGYRWDAIGSPITRYAGLANITLPTNVLAINAGGVAVGSATAGANGDLQPVIYAANSSTPIQLSSPAFSSTGHSIAQAYLLNDSNVIGGQIAKLVGAGDFGTRAVRWDASNTGYTELGVINTSTGGVTHSEADAMNADGTIVGVANKYDATGTTDLGPRGMRWAAGSTIGFELDTPFTRSDGFTTVGIRGVNAGGTAVGTVTKWAGSNAQGPRPVRWAAGGTAATVLDVLGGDVNGVTNANVGNINDAGAAVGTVTKYAANNVAIGSRAVRWDAGGTAATELGLLDPNTTSSAYRINNVGTVVGQAGSGATNIAHATIWPASGAGTTPLDLNALLAPDSGWLLVAAYGISDTGFVAGDGVYDPDGAGGVAAYKKAYSMLVPQAGTYGRGDANFDTKVDFADLVLLAQHYNAANPSQSINVGDFDLDGTTGFADLVALAQHYNTSLSSVAALGNAAFASDWALAQSLVPEPTMIAAAIGVAASLRRRR